MGTFSAGVRRWGSARLLVHGVLAVPAAVLLELDALAVVHLRLVGDVVPALALGALEGHGDPLVGGHGSHFLLVMLAFWATQPWRRVGRLDLRLDPGPAARSRSGDPTFCCVTGLGDKPAPKPSPNRPPNRRSS